MKLEPTQYPMIFPINAAVELRIILFLKGLQIRIPISPNRGKFYFPQTFL